MPRTVSKALTFPLAGVSRRAGYRRQTRPYSSPGASNVRTRGPSESRLRGGSRPGLEKLSPTNIGDVTALIPVSYIDSSGDRQYDLIFVAGGVLGFIRSSVQTLTTAELEDDTGSALTADDDITLDFAATVSTGAINAAVRNGTVLFADTTLKLFRPDQGTVEDVLATAGTVPTGETVIALYRDRVFLAGSTQAWHASRQGDPGDWDYGADMADPGRAVAGQLSRAGESGDVVTALIPIEDTVLCMATQNSLWLLRGDPTTGTLRNVSRAIGVIHEDAWAMDPDGLVVFLSNDGIYVLDPATGRPPMRFSEERVPDELREVSITSNTISMAFDHVERGFHLFITPTAGGDGLHWFIDLENRAFWPQRFFNAHQPTAAAFLTEEGLGVTVLAGKDGFVRRFFDGKADDDGEDLNSHVQIGPVRISQNDVRDGMLAELNAVIEDISSLNEGTLTWRVIMGRSAAEAAEKAIADLDLELAGNAPVSVAASGTFTEGRGRVHRPRTRGAWVVIWLSSRESWAFEVVAIVARQLGRHR